MQHAFYLPSIPISIISVIDPPSNHPFYRAFPQRGRGAGTYSSWLFGPFSIVVVLPRNSMVPPFEVTIPLQFFTAWGYNETALQNLFHHGSKMQAVTSLSCEWLADVRISVSDAHTARCQGRNTQVAIERWGLNWRHEQEIFWRLRLAFSFNWIDDFFSECNGNSKAKSGAILATDDILWQNPAYCERAIQLIPPQVMGDCDTEARPGQVRSGRCGQTAF